MKKRIMMMVVAFFLVATPAMALQIEFDFMAGDTFYLDPESPVTGWPPVTELTDVCGIFTNDEPNTVDVNFFSMIFTSSGEFLFTDIGEFMTNFTLDPGESRTLSLLRFGGAKFDSGIMDYVIAEDGDTMHILSLSLVGIVSGNPYFWEKDTSDLWSLEIGSGSGGGGGGGDNPAPVPEPATMFLFGAGLVGLANWRLKK